MDDLFWDVRQPTLSALNPHADPGDRRALGTIRELEDRVDRLAMICCAMWTILQANTNASDEDLMKLVQELDLTDGYADGKAKIRQVSDCVKCGRPVAIRHVRCLYCGAERKQATPFDGVL